MTYKPELVLVVCKACGVEIAAGGLCSYGCEHDCVGAVEADAGKRPRVRVVYKFDRAEDVKEDEPP